MPCTLTHQKHAFSMKPYKMQAPDATSTVLGARITCNFNTLRKSALTSNGSNNHPIETYRLHIRVQATGLSLLTIKKVLATLTPALSVLIPRWCHSRVTPPGFPPAISPVDTHVIVAGEPHCPAASLPNKPLESCGRCCTARKLCSDLSHIKKPSPCTPPLCRVPSASCT